MTDPLAMPEGGFFAIKAQAADILTITAEQSREVIRIDPTGRLFWRGREVETDDDFRKAMLDLAERLCPRNRP